MSRKKVESIDADGVFRHTVDGLLHDQDDGEPAMIWPSGSCTWYRYGSLYREKSRGGTSIWYLDGLKHREEGPAVTRLDGTTEWWRFGKRIMPSQISRVGLVESPEAVSEFPLSPLTTSTVTTVSDASRGLTQSTIGPLEQFLKRINDV